MKREHYKPLPEIFRNKKICNHRKKINIWVLLRTLSAIIDEIRKQ